MPYFETCCKIWRAKRLDMGNKKEKQYILDEGINEEIWMLLLGRTRMLAASCSKGTVHSLPEQFWPGFVLQESPNFIWYSSIINYVFHLRPSNNKNFKWGKRNPRQLDLAKQVPIFTGHSPFTGKRQGRKKHDNHKYNTKCISTHISIMLLMLHGNSSDIRVRM